MTTPKGPNTSAAGTGKASSKTKGFVAVQIAGQEYKIRSDSEDESLLQIAGYVDRAMKRVREGTGTVDSLDVAVLTCLNLAREILALREKKTDAIDDARMRTLIERVEAVMSTDTGSRAAATAGNQETRGAASTSRDSGSQATSHAASQTHAAAGEATQVEAEASVRTLELPSADSLRDPSAATPASSASDGTARATQGELPTQRVAAGGRDRAS